MGTYNSLMSSLDTHMSNISWGGYMNNDDDAADVQRIRNRCEVFLGGACGSTTWRTTEAIPELERRQISFYNPQVEEWHEGLVQEEASAKAEATVQLFVVSRETRGVASLVEAAALIASGRNVCLVIEDVDTDAIFEGHRLSEAETKDLNRGRRYLMDVLHERKRNGYQNACLCADVAEATDMAVKMALDKRLIPSVQHKRGRPRLLRKASL